MTIADLPQHPLIAWCDGSGRFSYMGRGPDFRGTPSPIQATASVLVEHVLAAIRHEWLTGGILTEEPNAQWIYSDPRPLRFSRFMEARHVNVAGFAMSEARTPLLIEPYVSSKTQHGTEWAINPEWLTASVEVVFSAQEKPDPLDICVKFSEPEPNEDGLRRIHYRFCLNANAMRHAASKVRHSFVKREAEVAA